MLHAKGFNTNVVTFERDYHSGSVPDRKIKIIGKVAHGNYLCRIIKQLKVIPVIRQEIKKNNLIYAFGSDMGYLSIVARLFIKMPVIIEVGDIREIQVRKNIFGSLFRYIDKLFINRCQLLISTSPAYIEEYYNKMLKVKTRSIVIENKLENECKVHIKRRTTDKITIGYFGLLRCEWSYKILKELAVRYSNKFEIIFAGYSMIPHDINDEIKNINNIKYLGEFKSPEDLPRLYNSIDLAWATYPYPKPNELNWKWARTNRFYECLCFNTPMIVLDGSGDSKFIKKYNLGIAIPLDSDFETINRSNKINDNDIKKWKNNINMIPKESYIYGNEAEVLKNNIMDIIN